MYESSEIIEYFMFKIFSIVSDMISNKKQDQLQGLYLKEFFSHYFERKETMETLLSFSNGLKVLEIVI